MTAIDQIIRTNRKTTALIIERDGRLVVRAPMRATDESIQKLISKKQKWIQTKQSHVKEAYPPFAPKEYVNGEGFWYLGKINKLQLVDENRPRLMLNGYFRLSRSALTKAPLVFERWYRQQAFQVISERVEWYAKKYGYSYGRVNITSARTRWGSCSSRSTLSFSWRLVMAPVPVIDYVVVHELVHLKMKSHSKEYWSRVKLIMPDYQSKIDWLEKNGHLLNLR